METFKNFTIIYKNVALDRQIESLLNIEKRHHHLHDSMEKLKEKMNPSQVLHKIEIRIYAISCV